MTTNNRMMLIAGVLLAGSALLGAGLLWVTNWHAEPYIEENKRQTLLRSLGNVMPANYYDNNLLEDIIYVNSRALTAGRIQSKVYRARKNNIASGIAMTVVAPDGYNGTILLLIGLNYDGVITGVSVLAHQETPGLGDAIEAEKSDWIQVFKGLDRDNPNAEQWKVKKDGGQFEQFTGATITPRAIVKAIYTGLNFYSQHRDVLYNLDANSEYSEQ